MTDKEALHIMVGLSGVFFVGGIALGTTLEANSAHSAARDAEAAATCLKAFPGENNNVSQQTINCMENGWVDGVTISPSPVVKGDATELLEGFIADNRYEASHFDATAPGGWGLAAGAAGFWMSVSIVSSEFRQDEARSSGSTAAASTEGDGSSDEDTDDDEPPES